MAKSIVQNANATVRLSLSFLCPTMRGLYTLLPPEAEKKCYDLISGYKNLTIKTVHSRKRTLGNYRQCGNGEHLITINDNLSPYTTLVVLIHEIAHLETRLRYGKSVPAHGKEWKQTYTILLKSFIYSNIFPKSIAENIMLHAMKPRATMSKEFIGVLNSCHTDQNRRINNL